MEFKKIEDAPISRHAADQILCRFWYPHMEGHWVYFVAHPNGKNTIHPGYAPPEEWAELEVLKPVVKTEEEPKKKKTK